MQQRAISLEDLRRKYERMAAWRREKSALGSEPERAVLRAFAREFPGALREIEVLSLATIDARIAAIARCQHERAAPERWMLLLCAFHERMRAALFVKRAAQRGSPVEQIVADCAAHTGAVIDEAFIDAVNSPERGRLRPVVIASIAVTFGEDPEAVAHIVLHRDAAIDRGNSAAYEEDASPAG